MEAREAKAARFAKDAPGAEGGVEAVVKDSEEAPPAASVVRRQGPMTDFKDVRTLQRLTTPQGKLFSRKRSGTCATHQRQVKRAVKRARFMALLPYVGR